MGSAVEQMEYQGSDNSDIDDGEDLSGDPALQEGGNERGS
jgi:hypothetical protein